MKVKILSIANHKGGVGKSTSCACIGAALALLEQRILLIDLDAQQNLSFTLSQQEDPETSIYDTLVHNSPLPVINIRERLDLVPASLDLARAEIDLSSKIARERILRSAIEHVIDAYDYIIIDCPPSLGIVTTNALVASDLLFIPLTAEALPVKGLTMIDSVVDEIKRCVNPDLDLGGVFFCRYNYRKLNHEVISKIQERYGDKVLKTIVRENISLAEMPMAGQTIFEYDAKSNGATDYMNLAKEILTKTN